MSSILGVFTNSAPLPDDSVARRMLARGRRGADRSGIWRGEEALLGVARASWEAGHAFSGPTLVACRNSRAVAADASLYYRDDLQRALAGWNVEASDDTPSHLIAGAFSAWGEECANYLEGDFAWILWDGDTRTAICARDPVGTRPLYYAQIDGVLVVASSIASVLEYPGCPADLNCTAIAETAAGLFASSRETCYRAISQLPAGTRLVWRDGEVRLVSYWEPPPIKDRGGPAFDRAAEELREILCRAVVERLDTEGPTSVWLSGGWDSSAVFAAGAHASEDVLGARHLRPVSISYPPGDPGREDELIQAIADHWSTQVHWLDIRDIPLLEAPLDRAAARDEPFAHAFEMWNRALARGSAQEGARVALAGVGADFLFSVSPIYLADLFRTGRWGSLFREWRARGFDPADGLRSLARWAILPALPQPVRRVAAFVSGPDVAREYLDRVAPAWIEPSFARGAGLEARERARSPRRKYREHAAQEMYWGLSYAYGPRIMASVFGFGMDAGVEVRNPFYDSRLMRFAASRPVNERASGRETKLLLRRAMSGLLPDPVLQPRASRTGVTGTYLVNSLRGPFATLLRDTFSKPVLAELGIVNAEVLQHRCNDFLQSGGEILGVHLLLTLQTELWVRSRLDPISE